MTRLFIDASALVAMMTREPGDAAFARTMSASSELLCSPVAIWEATVAVARKRQVDIGEAQASVTDLLARFGIVTVSIGSVEGGAALSAWARYGKVGLGPAKLNMGDCFAYACAKTNAARLLYKGDDFSHTDMAWPEPA